MDKPQKLTTRQYVGMVRDLNLIMAQMPNLFNYNQQLYESEIVDSLAKKTPRKHKAMIISQGFNIKTVDLATFLKHCKQAETTDNTALSMFPSSD